MINKASINGLISWGGWYVRGGWNDWPLEILNLMMSSQVTSIHEIDPIRYSPGINIGIRTHFFSQSIFCWFFRGFKLMGTNLLPPLATAPFETMIFRTSYVFFHRSNALPILHLWCIFEVQVAFFSFIFEFHPGKCFSYYHVKTPNAPCKNLPGSQHKFKPFIFRYMDIPYINSAW